MAICAAIAENAGMLPEAHADWGEAAEIASTLQKIYEEECEYVVEDSERRPLSEEARNKHSGQPYVLARSHKIDE